MDNKLVVAYFETVGYVDGERQVRLVEHVCETFEEFNLILNIVPDEDILGIR